MRQGSFLHRTAAVLSCLLLCLLCNYTPLHAQQAPPITYQRYDTAITLQPDGSFLVQEIQQIRFDGAFHTAYAEIPRTLTSSVDDVLISEGEKPYTRNGVGPGSFTAETGTDSIIVNWEYTMTQPSDVRTFTLAYKVKGGLWVYPQGDILEWRAVPADRSGILVENSTVTVTLPATVAADQLRYTAYGPDLQTQVNETKPLTTTQSQVVFTAKQPLPNGVNFQVQVGFPGNLVTAEQQPWQAQEDAAQLVYRFTAIDTDLTINADGTLTIDEAQQVAVEAGALTQGNRQMATRFLDAIDQVTLHEGDQAFTEATTDCDYCFHTATVKRKPTWVQYDARQRQIKINESQAGQIGINWQLPALVRGEKTTLHLRYRVQGALQILPDKQQLNWTAVFSGRQRPVETATVHLHLPPDVKSENVQLMGGNIQWQNDGSALIQAPGPIPETRTWVIQITLPAQATGATPSLWQQDLERAAAAARQDEINQARLQLGFGAGALVLVLAGLAGLYLLWYSRGRDKPLPAVADYLTEPPSALPPAIVAYLLDEQPTAKGALASLFHLATLGLIWIRLSGTIRVKRARETELQAGEVIQTPSGESVPIPRHLATLFNWLRRALPTLQEESFYSIGDTFQAILPRVYLDMGQEATQFFDELPDVARRRWLVTGQWAVLLGMGAAIVLTLWWRWYIGWIAIAPGIALTLIGFALILVSRWMPRRTALGVEEAQRWRAFRHYLQNLKTYGNQADAQKILDRYFAYAVALNVESVVLEQAEALGGQLPAWSYTTDWTPQPHRPAHAEPSSSSNKPNIERPSSTSPTPPTIPTTPEPNEPTRPWLGERSSLSGMSRQLGEALASTSHDLGNLLSTAMEGNGSETPFGALWTGTKAVGEAGKTVGSTTLDILGDILESAASGDGGGGYSSSSHSSSSSWSSSWGSSSSHSSGSSSSSSSSGRDSSDRRSGGGGSRGFG
ncbi:MAG: DUF2207 domain-containing protein [Caldilineaceae bacterium]